jgi:hypothetical protein
LYVISSNVILDQDLQDFRISWIDLKINFRKVRLIVKPYFVLTPANNDLFLFISSSHDLSYISLNPVNPDSDISLRQLTHRIFCMMA